MLDDAGADGRCLHARAHLPARRERLRRRPERPDGPVRRGVRRRRLGRPARLPIARVAPDRAPGRGRRSSSSTPGRRAISTARPTTSGGSQCEAAVADLARDDPRITSLRDVTPERPRGRPRPARPDRLRSRRARRHRERPGRGDRRRRSPPTTSTPSAGCSPRATPRCATCSRSARPSSTRWSRSRPRSTASSPPG